jgi:hypothetical protein
MHRGPTSTLLAVLAALAILASGCGQSGSATRPAADDGTDRALALGRPAVAPFVDYGTSRQAQTTKVRVRVLRVRKGRIADLAPFKLSGAQRRSVPYYVDARFENLGGFALSRNLLRTSMEDARGREHRPATLVLLGGSFGKCPETPRAPLRPGGSFTACSPILLPKGTEPGRVRFQGDVKSDPLLWELET